METDQPTNTITVTGTGSAQAVPDVLCLSLALECQRDTVGAAYEDLGTAVREVTESLGNNGVSDRDVSTTGLNLRAEVAWGQSPGPTVTGYVAGTSLSVRLRAPDAAQVISDAVTAGGNYVRLNGMVPGFTDESAVVAAARNDAWRTAEAAARQLALLAVATLGKPQSIMEQPSQQNVVPVIGMQRAASVESVPIEAGTGAATCTLTVTWPLIYPAPATRDPLGA